MKLPVCTDTETYMFSKQVETKFEMLLKEYPSKKLILIGLPLEKLPLNNDGLPFIVQKIYNYLIDYGLHDQCLFDDVFSNNWCKDNIIKAYELVSGCEQSCKTFKDVNLVDIATVLVIWLYYLPEPLVSPKQFSLICDLSINQKYQEVINSMNNLNREILKQIVNIMDSYEKQHNSCQEKLAILFTLLLTKDVDISNQNNSLQFINNLKTILTDVKTKNNKYMFNIQSSVLKENFNRNDSLFDKNSLSNKKICYRSFSDVGLQRKTDATEVNPTLKCNVLKKSSSCNLGSLFSKEGDFCNKSFSNDISFKEDNLLKSGKNVSSEINQDCSTSVVDELIYSSEMDDVRNIERTMLTHSRSNLKQNKKKSIRNHVERILKSGFLSNEDNLLLQNTLELMKILSKIKSVHNQINIQKEFEDEFGYQNKNTNKHFPELNFLNHRLEQLDNQKNYYLIKTGLSYGRLYNRTVLNLKSAQKEAFMLYEREKNNMRYRKENEEKLITDIYNIQVVLDYLENNCGGKELPWRSSKSCPGFRRKTKKQLNCVTVVSDLQTISEHEVMETVSHPLFTSI